MSHVLLTGVTGFVGKVVLFDLLSQREKLGIERVSVLIRSKPSRHGSPQLPAERFQSAVARSEIFRRDVEDTVRVDEESDLNAGKSSGHRRNSLEVETGETATVFDEFALALHDVNQDVGLAVDACSEQFSF